MVLRVPYERFGEAVKERLGATEAHASPRGALTLLTAGDPARGLVLAAVTERPRQEIEERLAQHGVRLSEGVWLESLSAVLDDGGPGAHVAAIAYRSSEATPGLWVEAYPGAVTEAQALRDLYDEFIETGEVAEATFEEFARSANANVVILSPEQISTFADRKR
jgi:hypothetical protein